MSFSSSPASVQNSPSFRVPVTAPPVSTSMTADTRATEPESATMGSAPATTLNETNGDLRQHASSSQEPGPRRESFFAQVRRRSKSFSRSASRPASTLLLANQENGASEQAQKENVATDEKTQANESFVASMRRRSRSMSRRFSRPLSAMLGEADTTVTAPTSSAVPTEAPYIPVSNIDERRRSRSRSLTRIMSDSWGVVSGDKARERQRAENESRSSSRPQSMVIQQSWSMTPIEAVPPVDFERYRHSIIGLQRDTSTAVAEPESDHKYDAPQEVATAGQVSEPTSDPVVSAIAPTALASTQTATTSGPAHARSVEAEQGLATQRETPHAAQTIKQRNPAQDAMSKEDSEYLAHRTSSIDNDNPSRSIPDHEISASSSIAPKQVRRTSDITTLPSQLRAHALSKQASRETAGLLPNSDDKQTMLPGGNVHGEEVIKNSDAQQLDHTSMEAVDAISAPVAQPVTLAPTEEHTREGDVRPMCRDPEPLSVGIVSGGAGTKTEEAIRVQDNHQALGATSASIQSSETQAPLEQRNGSKDQDMQQRVGATSTSMQSIRPQASLVTAVSSRSLGKQKALDARLAGMQGMSSQLLSETGVVDQGQHNQQAGEVNATGMQGVSRHNPPEPVVVSRGQDKRQPPPATAAEVHSNNGQSTAAMKVDHPVGTRTILQTEDSSSTIARNADEHANAIPATATAVQLHNIAQSQYASAHIGTVRPRVVVKRKPSMPSRHSSQYRRPVSRRMISNGGTETPLEEKLDRSFATETFAIDLATLGEPRSAPQLSQHPALREVSVADQPVYNQPYPSVRPVQDPAISSQSFTKVPSAKQITDQYGLEDVDKASFIEDTVQSKAPTEKQRKRRSSMWGSMRRSRTSLDHPPKAEPMSPQPAKRNSTIRMVNEPQESQQDAKKLRRSSKPPEAESTKKRFSGLGTLFGRSKDSVPKVSKSTKLSKRPSPKQSAQGSAEMIRPTLPRVYDSVKPDYAAYEASRQRHSQHLDQQQTVPQYQHPAAGRSEGPRARPQLAGAPVVFEPGHAWYGHFANAHHHFPDPTPQHPSETSEQAPYRPSDHHDGLSYHKVRGHGLQTDLERGPADLMAAVRSTHDRNVVPQTHAGSMTDQRRPEHGNHRRTSNGHAEGQLTALPNDAQPLRYAAPPTEGPRPSQSEAGMHRHLSSDRATSHPAYYQQNIVTSPGSNRRLSQPGDAMYAQASSASAEAAPNGHRHAASAFDFGFDSTSFHNHGERQGQYPDVDSHSSMGWGNHDPSPHMRGVSYPGQEWVPVQA